LPPSLSIIGLIQPLGAIMPISEMQSRWIVQILKGNVGLPTKEEMLQDIEYKKKEMESR
jgi:dimethylaniline monooxygenase (N-oxide forming)